MWLPSKMQAFQTEKPKMGCWLGLHQRPEVEILKRAIIVWIWMSPKAMCWCVVPAKQCLKSGSLECTHSAIVCGAEGLIWWWALSLASGSPPPHDLLWHRPKATKSCDEESLSNISHREPFSGIWPNNENLTQEWKVYTTFKPWY